VPTKSESRSRAEPNALIEEPNATPLPDFRLLFESAPGLYLVLSPDLTILAASDAYLAATLTKRAQILGRSLFDVFPDNPDDAAATGVNNLGASLKRVIKDKQSDTMALQKYDIPIPGTEPVAFEERFWSPVNAPVLGEDGELLYIIHRVEDVTEFVRLKDHSAKTQAQAERMIKMEAEIFLRAQQIQRTNNQLRELQDIHEGNLAELEKATEAAESANRELEAFSYSVAHDLRAPLRSLDGFSQALLEDYSDKLDDEGKSYLLRLRAGAQRMARLIDDLLSLSRVSRNELVRSEVDLSALARNIGERLLQATPERTISLSVAPELRARGDARLLTAALENLLGNAVKFTAKREQARIEVGSRRIHGKITFFVSDNGAGFDMAYADKLFGAFQRLHSTHEYEGTGIGLATVQRIVSRHGGQIWPEAKPDEGATFYFTLES
jgi:signal transduction histidine kinase